MELLIFYQIVLANCSALKINSKLGLLKELLEWKSEVCTPKRHSECNFILCHFGILLQSNIEFAFYKRLKVIKSFQTLQYNLAPLARYNRHKPLFLTCPCL